MREQLMNNVRQTAQQQGKTLDAFIEEQGGQQQFGMMMMMQIRELLVQGFALDALFRHEHLVLNDDDINAACRLRKRSVGRKVQRSAFLWLQCPNRSRAEWFGGCHRGAIIRNRTFPQLRFQRCRSR